MHNIQFRSKRVGIYYSCSETYETFQWSLKNDSLKIFNNPKNSVTTFFDTVYTTTFAEEKGFLKLLIKNNTTTYYLLK